MTSSCLVYNVPYHCHNADIYLSRLSTCDSRPCSKTALEDETVSVLSANGASLLWFFLHGHFGSSFTINIGTKTLVQLFMPFFKFVKLALIKYHKFFLVC